MTDHCQGLPFNWSSQLLAIIVKETAVIPEFIHFLQPVYIEQLGRMKTIP
jgi:hypothetical protein